MALIPIFYQYSEDVIFINMMQHRKYSLQLKKHQTQHKRSIDLKNFHRQTKSQVERYDDGANQAKKKVENLQDLAAIKISLDFKSNNHQHSAPKSRKDISLNTLYKERIMKQRRSYSFSDKNQGKKRQRHNSIFETANRSMQESYLPHSKTFNPSSKKTQQLSLHFATVCLNLEQEFRHNLDQSMIDKAFENICSLLNYSIDINNRSYFLKTLHVMCQFYFTLQCHNIALKFYCQYREASILMKDYRNLIMSLIGISKCIGLGENSKDAIVILKKGLQYAWFANDKEFELLIYDELGQRYYKMGQIQKASTYHNKYSHGITEPIQSPLRALSKQKIQNLQQIYLTHNYDNISPLFLAHLSLPIKHTDILPPFSSELTTERSKISKISVFKAESPEISYQMKRLFKSWMFQEQTQEPSLQIFTHDSQSNKELHKATKYVYIGFRNTQTMKMKTLAKSSFIDPPKTEVKKKMNLDQQIRSFVESPGLDKYWYQNLVRRVQNDQRRKLTEVKDPVRLNKHQTSLKSKLQSLKSVFRQLIEQFCP